MFRGKKLLVVLALLLSCGLLLGLLWFLFPNRSDIRGAATQASRHFEAGDGDDDQGGAGGPNGPAGGIPPNLLGPDDAAYLRYAAAAREAIRAPEGYRPRYVDDDLSRLLFAEAERRRLSPEGHPAGTPWDPSRSSLRPPPAEAPAEVRTAFLRLLEAGIHEVSERVAIALADRAVLKHIDAEAELRTLHLDLTGLVATGKLSSEPLALLPPDQLDRAISALRPHERALAERLALHDTADTRMALDHVRARLGRYQTVRESQSYSEFHSDGSGFRSLASEVPKAKWAAARADFAARVRVEADRLKAEEGSIPGQREIIRFVHQQRGPPPDAPAARLFDAIRYFDLDVATAVRCGARLDAAVSDLDRELPDTHPLRGLADRQRILAVLSDADFHEFERLIELGRLDSASLPTGPTDRKLFTESWAEATSAESGRRNAPDGVTNQFPSDPVVKRVVEKHLKSRDGPLTSLAESKYLANAQQRFRDHRTMPDGVRNEVERLVTATIVKYQERVKSAHAAYTKLAEQAAQATATVEAALGGEFDAYRRDLRQLIREYRDYVWTAQDRQIKLPPDVRDHLALLTTWFFGPDNPPPDPLPPDPLGPKPKGPGPGGSGAPAVANGSGRIPPKNGGGQTAVKEPTDPYRPGPRPYLLMADPAIENSVDAVRLLEVSLTAKLAGMAQEPPRFATEKGQYAVPRAALVRGFEWNASGMDLNKTRLPKSQSKWEGRLKSEAGESGRKVPFDFEREVWDFKSFQPVGGGIHLGTKAKYEGAPLSGSVLRYDAKRQELVLSGPSANRGEAPRVYRMTGVKPEVLKPLYQFVSAGRNAAISIGWGMERSVELVPSTLDSSVLLDPYLVDTPLGQDLVLADTIPWEFHSKSLDRGKRVSFHERFSELKKASETETAGRLDGVFKDLTPYRREDAAAWGRAHAAELGNGVDADISLAILESANLGEAQDRIVGVVARRRLKEEIDGELKKHGLAKIDGTSEDDLESGVRRLQEQLLRDELAATGRVVTDLPPRVIDDLDKAAKQATKKALESIRTEMREGMKKNDLFKGAGDGYDRVVLDVLTDRLQVGIRSPSGCSAALMRTWLAASVAASPVEKREDAVKLGARLLTLGQTALSVLMDEPGQTVVSIADGKLEVTGKMRYWYARTRIVVDGERVYFGKAPGHDREVDQIAPLNQLVNDNYPEVEREFAPLGRVARNAELAALLRWAIQAKADGSLGGIDLSELAGTPARDRKKYPTPDLLTR